MLIQGRTEIAIQFNKAIRNGHIKSPIVLSRDHHDVSGTYRETANIYDGSHFTADMVCQNVIGDSFRGATWVALHNGGGVGWGEFINGGFGLVLDGSDDAEKGQYDVVVGCQQWSCQKRIGVETRMQYSILRDKWDLSHYQKSLYLIKFKKKQWKLLVNDV